MNSKVKPEENIRGSAAIAVVFLFVLAAVFTIAVLLETPKKSNSQTQSANGTRRIAFNTFDIPHPTIPPRDLTVRYTYAMNDRSESALVTSCSAQQCNLRIGGHNTVLPSGYIGMVNTTRVRVLPPVPNSSSSAQLQILKNSDWVTVETGDILPK